ncbi:hypothetical protein [Sphingomonas xinjiangensis]|uniref:Uncharacterized protein n=1 Tax=Sphingomonas xinjiangensis TaxID=643568 RepID=A0A840YI82_9SPHN|nr:hypothetical protein [Sphingomonas xinjiangensis]MBB5712125.1 hypothetical protein [Sphingomonas xinjiangensis]
MTFENIGAPVVLSRHHGHRVSTTRDGHTARQVAASLSLTPEPLRFAA